jgi:hypothetical protein
MERQTAASSTQGGRTARPYVTALGIAGPTTINCFSAWNFRQRGALNGLLSGSVR